MTQLSIGARYVRSGFWLLLLGLFMSFGMVLHYLVGARYPTGTIFLQNITLWYACPWTLSTAVVLGGALGMMVIGALYLTIGKQTQVFPVGWIERGALVLCTISLLAMFSTGFVGYFVVDAVWPAFLLLPCPSRQEPLASNATWLHDRLCGRCFARIYWYSTSKLCLGLSCVAFIRT